MKTNFKSVMMMAAALVLGFSSCSNDDEVDNGQNGEPKSVYLKISQEASTYAEGAAVANGTAVGFSSGHLYFVNGSGVIQSHYTITNAPTAGTNIDINDLTGTGSTISNLPGATAAVHIVGNAPASVTLPTSGNISTVKAVATDVQDQGTIANVSLYGSNTITLVTGNQYTTTVNLAPTVARVELTDITASGVITGFQVDGIFIDNYYSKGNIDSSVLPANLVNGTTATLFGDNTADYPTALKPSIYDWYAAGLASTSLVAAPTTGVWGYNVFATAAGSDVARIVVKLSNITTNDGSTYPNPAYYLTVKGFKNGATPITVFKAGEVYNIGAGDLTFDETNVTPLPNMSTIDVEVKVSLATWSVVNVTPEL